MELREIELFLSKLERIGVGCCESCGKQVRIAEIDVYNGTFLCAECLRKVAWKTDSVLELPS